MPRLQVDTFSKFVVIGDRVLIKPREAEEQTSSGLYLPPTVHEKEKIHSGYVIKAGPGYPVSSEGDDEPWLQGDARVKYIPLQAREGDLAIYLQKHAYDIEFNNEKYLIIPQSAILMLIRDDSLFD